MRFQLSSAALALSLAIAAPAFATVTIFDIEGVTYTGANPFVASDIDNFFGLRGDSGSNIPVAVKISMSFDDNTPGAGTVTYVTPEGLSSSEYNAPSAPGSASVFVGDRTIDLGSTGSRLHFYSIPSQPPYEQQQVLAFSFSNESSSLGLFFVNYGDELPLGDWHHLNTELINIATPTQGLVVHTPPGQSEAYFYFDVTSARITSIPEPGTWSLLIMGVGSCGASLRRRRALPVGRSDADARQLRVAHWGDRARLRG